MSLAWTDLPLDRPVIITGSSPDKIVMSIESAPVGAPAIITYTADLPTRLWQLIGDLLVRLDHTAQELFPAWLPEAELIDDPAGAGVAAVRSIALRTARRNSQHGPALADLAERSLWQRYMPSGASPRRGPRPRFSPEVQAKVLSWAIATSFGRPSAAIFVRIEMELSDIQEQVVVEAARWLTDCGGFGVWLTGEALRATDDLGRVPFDPPTPVAMPREETFDDLQPLTYPAVAGRPHPASRAEQLLEAALSTADWAAGREWNQTHQVHPLTNPIRLDLLWRTERCIVEIDGAEHRQAEQFAADRQRDVLMQLAGYAVLRFTNNQVIRHRELVMEQIHRGLFSGHPVKVEPNYAIDGFFERAQRPSIVGVKDSPGLQVGDHLLDNPPDLVDLPIVFLLPFLEFTTGGLPVRGKHRVSYVAFVADPVRGIERYEDARLPQSVRVVAAAVDGIGDPGQRAVEGAGDLDAQARGLVLAGEQLPAIPP